METLGDLIQVFKSLSVFFQMLIDALSLLFGKGSDEEPKDPDAANQ